MIEFKDVPSSFTELPKENKKPYSEVVETVATAVGSENFTKGHILSYPAVTTDDFVNVIFSIIKEGYFDGFLSQDDNLKLNNIKAELKNFFSSNEKNNLEKLLSYLIGSSINMYTSFYEKNNNSTNKN